jgi:hypothetical protein
MAKGRLFLSIKQKGIEWRFIVIRLTTSLSQLYYTTNFGIVNRKIKNFSQSGIK